MLSPTVKSGGTRPPSPTDRRPWRKPSALNMTDHCITPRISSVVSLLRRSQLQFQMIFEVIEISGNDYHNRIQHHHYFRYPH